MNQSVINICNLALTRIGGNQIKIIHDLNDSGEEARVCARLYPHLLSNMLRRHPFGFALVEKPLALLAIHPDKKLAYEYAYPTDCLQLWQVGVEGHMDDYRLPDYVVGYGVAGRVIGCALERAVARYSVDVNDPNRFDPLFADALAWALAAELAIALQNDKQNFQLLTERAMVATALAMGSDANEASHQALEPYFITTRY